MLIGGRSSSHGGESAKVVIRVDFVRVVDWVGRAGGDSDQVAILNGGIDGWVSGYRRYRQSLRGAAPRLAANNVTWGWKVGPGVVHLKWYERFEP